VSPLATLARGYAILQREPDGGVVRGPADTGQGQVLRARLAHGSLRLRVEGGES
jgi:exodeoxyribonuclease VII large subunit